MGPLAVHPQNPRYFQNTATGEVVYLTGSHTWANLVDIGPSDPPPAFDFEKYVEWMAKLNHNFMRMWTWELVSWDTTANGEGKHHTSAPLPYARTGPGTALDGKPKFDLTKFDPAYFDRLAQRVAAARAHGIYVSVMLFEGWGLQFSTRRVGGASRSIRRTTSTALTATPTRTARASRSTSWAIRRSPRSRKPTSAR